MATRHTLRLVQRRFSSGGKVLGKEEKATENVFSKCSHLKSPTMATRHALRLVPHRFSSGGNVLSEEEKAAENEFLKVPKNQAEFNELAQKAEALKEENASLRTEVLKEEILSLKAELRNKHANEVAKEAAKERASASAFMPVGLLYLGMLCYLIF